MDILDEIKLIFISIGIMTTSTLGILVLPMMVLLGTNVIDYITGIKAAKYRNKQITSKEGVTGITKKVMMWFLIIIGYFIDLLIFESFHIASIELPIDAAVSCLVAVWLTANEMISILENLKDMGIEIPVFLGKIAKSIKSHTENNGGGE